MIEAGLNDSDPSVRKAACTAVSCLCEWLEEECAAKHTTLVPVRFSHSFDSSTSYTDIPDGRSS